MPAFPCPPVRGSPKARFSTLPSTPRRRKMPILCAQKRTAARNESDPPITQRWEHFLSSRSDPAAAIEKVKTRCLLSKDCAPSICFGNLHERGKEPLTALPTVP